MNYLENHLYRNLIDLIGNINGKNLCVALSMGADSTALFYSLLAVQKILKKQNIIFTVCACHLNHMLRSQSQIEEDSFIAAMKLFNVPYMVKKINVSSYSKKHKTSIETSARKIRYDFYSDARQALNAHYILTAHHKDDMVETMLFNLFRGTGFHGLRSIPAKRDYIIRPFLDITKDVCISYLKENKIDWFEDESNDDISYARNYIRHTIIPKITERFPGFYTSLYSLQDILKQQDLYLNRRFQNVLKKNVWKSKWFEKQHLFMQRELLYRKLAQLLPYKPFTFAFLNEVISRMKKSHGQGEICELDHVFIYAAYGYMYFIERHRKYDEPFYFTFADIPLKKVWNDYEVLITKSRRTVQNKNAKSMVYIAIKNKYDIVSIDSYNPGDYVVYSQGRSKKVHDICIDLKIPKFLRKHIPVIKIVDTNYLHDKKIVGLYIPKEFIHSKKKERSVIVDPDYFVDFKAKKDYIKIKIIRIKDEQF